MKIILGSDQSRRCILSLLSVVRQKRKTFVLCQDKKNVCKSASACIVAYSCSVQGFLCSGLLSSPKSLNTPVESFYHLLLLILWDRLLRKIQESNSRTVWC